MLSNAILKFGGAILLLLKTSLVFLFEIEAITFEMLGAWFGCAMVTPRNVRHTTFRQILLFALGLWVETYPAVAYVHFLHQHLTN